MIIELPAVLPFTRCYCSASSRTAVIYFAFFRFTLSSRIRYRRRITGKIRQKKKKKTYKSIGTAGSAAAGSPPAE